MLTIQHNSFFSLNNKLNGFKKCSRGFVTVMSKRRDFQAKSNDKRPVLQINVPNTTLARSAIVVLSLGFIDAGYSGDWSRIGVIPKETEELLKIAAFFLVPLCIFLALSLSDESTE